MLKTQNSRNIFFYSAFLFALCIEIASIFLWNCKFINGLHPIAGIVIAAVFLPWVLFRKKTTKKLLVYISLGLLISEFLIMLPNGIEANNNHCLSCSIFHIIYTIAFWVPLIIYFCSILYLFSILIKDSNRILNLSFVLSVSLFEMFIILLADGAFRKNHFSIIVFTMFFCFFSYFYFQRKKRRVFCFLALILCFSALISKGYAGYLYSFKFVLFITSFSLFSYLLYPFINHDKAHAAFNSFKEITPIWLTNRINGIKNFFSQTVQLFRKNRKAFLAVLCIVLLIPVIGISIAHVFSSQQDNESTPSASPLDSPSPAPTVTYTRFEYDLESVYPNYLVYSIGYTNNYLCFDIALCEYYSADFRYRLDIFDPYFKITDIEVVDKYDADTGLKWQLPYRCFATVTTDISKTDPRLNSILDLLYRQTANELINAHPVYNYSTSSTDTLAAYYDTFNDCFPIDTDTSFMAEVLNHIKVKPSYIKSQSPGFSLARFKEEKNNFTSEDLNKIKENYNAEIKPLSPEAESIMFYSDYKLVSNILLKKTFIGDEHNFILGITSHQDDIYICVLGDSDTGIFKRKSEGLVYSEGDYFQDEYANVYDLWIAKFDQDLNLIWKTIVKSNLGDEYETVLYDFKVIHDDFDDVISLTFCNNQISQAGYINGRGQEVKEVIYGSDVTQNVSLYTDSGKLNRHEVQAYEESDTTTWSRERLYFHPYLHNNELYVEVCAAEPEYMIRSYVMQTSDGGYLFYGNDYNNAFADYDKTSFHAITTDVFEEKYRKLYDRSLDDIPFSDNFVCFTDVLVIKTNADLKVEWYRYCGGSGGDIVSRAVEGNDGQFYFIGETWSRDGDVVDYKPASEGEGGCSNYTVPSPAKWSFIISKEGNLTFSQCYTDPYYIIDSRNICTLPDRVVFFEPMTKRWGAFSYDYQGYFNLYTGKSIESAK